MFLKNQLLERQYLNEVYLFQIHWDRGVKETLFFESIPQFHISHWKSCAKYIISRIKPEHEWTWGHILHAKHDEPPSLKPE